jgi:tripartite-type tricarboxylate transporter receptor subunit TctC
VRKRLEALSVEASGLSGKAFADFAANERKAIGPIIEKAGIKPQ